MHHSASEPASQALDLIGEHEVHVGALTTAVRIHILRRPSDGALFIRPSHFVKTAIQYLPYSVNNPSYLSESALLAELMETWNGFYDQAVRRGYKPTEDWLVPNTSFPGR